MRYTTFLCNPRGPTLTKFFDKIRNLLELSHDSKIRGLIPKIPKDSRLPY